MLTDHTQSVAVDGAVSRQIKVIDGVSQGTILGSLLFILFTNDIADKILREYFCLEMIKIMSW